MRYVDACGWLVDNTYLIAVVRYGTKKLEGKNEI
jgi:hypothetical protein